MIAYFKINHYYNEYPDALSFSKDRIPKFYNFFFVKTNQKRTRHALIGGKLIKIRNSTVGIREISGG